MGTGSIVFRGRKFSVRRESVRGRDGRDHVYESVVHPGAAVVLPLLPNGRIVLIRNRRHAIGRVLLELPAGTLDPPESARRCAARELTEETGYVAGKIRALVSFYSSPGICTERMFAFVATDLRDGRSAPEPGEDIRVETLTWPQALRAIRAGRIVDAKTIAALLYYDRFAGNAASRRRGRAPSPGVRTRP